MPEDAGISTGYGCGYGNVTSFSEDFFICGRMLLLENLPNIKFFFLLSHTDSIESSIKNLWREYQSSLRLNQVHKWGFKVLLSRRFVLYGSYENRIFRIRIYILVN